MKHSLLLLTLALYLVQPIYASTTPDAPMLCEIIKPIQNIVSIAIAAGGTAFFVMLVWGSITWLTAGANASQASQASATITWAIIGLVLLVSSYAILMVIQSFTGVNLTQIKFPWIDNGVSPPPACN